MRISKKPKLLNAAAFMLSPPYNDTADRKVRWRMYVEAQLARMAATVAKGAVRRAVVAVLKQWSKVSA
ncbi:hypothetical protein GOBAR_DD15198 [Gossypium barbadense]|nr:hypothetical protein GOBAR_DD15198 [Gossypium barbadense]